MVVVAVADATGALRVAARLQPDVVVIPLSNADLPERRQLELTLARTAAPWRVVVVGRSEGDALEAFAAGAVGFALGSEDDEGLRRAADRIRPPVSATPAGAPAQVRRSDRLVIRDGARSLVLRPATISWIEAAGNYVRIHGDQNHRLVRSTLAHLETSLDPHQFVRVHRGTLVNLDRVVMVEPAGRQLVAVLRDGTRLTISRSHRASFSASLAGG
jgi:two-component system LytT family response regulator